jgi:hypothetical protein
VLRRFAPQLASWVLICPNTNDDSYIFGRLGTMQNLDTEEQELLESIENGEWELEI